MPVCNVKDCSEYAAREVCPYHGKAIRQGRIPAEPHWFTQPNPACTIPGCSRLAQSRKEPLICHVHRATIREGRDPESLRPKRRNGEPPKPCGQDGCTAPAVSKGLCQSHYSKSRTTYKNPECLTPGCERRTSKGHCTDHRPPPEPRPEMQHRICAVPKCETEFLSSKNLLCLNHRGDRRKKGLDLDKYLELRAIQVCQACGEAGPTVIDHKHGHHPTDNQMCPDCIRGVLCNGCNTALGHAKEGAARLRGLADYIESFQ